TQAGKAQGRDLGTQEGLGYNTGLQQGQAKGEAEGEAFAKQAGWKEGDARAFAANIAGKRKWFSEQGKQDVLDEYAASHRIRIPNSDQAARLVDANGNGKFEYDEAALLEL